MAPITPNEAYNYDKSFHHDCDSLEDSINKRLKKDWNGVQAIYITTQMQGHQQPVRDVVIKRFEQAGWKIEYSAGTSYGRDDSGPSWTINARNFQPQSQPDRSYGRSSLAAQIEGVERAGLRPYE